MVALVLISPIFLFQPRKTLAFYITISESIEPLGHVSNQGEAGVKGMGTFSFLACLSASICALIFFFASSSSRFNLLSFSI